MTTSRAQELKQKYGKAVLVTGASSGIGKELALQFAQAGFDLIITARNQAALEKMRVDLESRYKTSVRVMAGDHSKEEDIEQLKKAVADLDIGIAIINAGFGNTGSFANTELTAELNMVDLNVRNLLSLSHYFGKKFVAKKRGALVVLSSMVSFQGVPYMANYSATKAYVQTFAEAIGYELKPYGVDVLSVAPGPVDTGFSDRARISMSNMATSEVVAKNIIAAIGKKRTVYPAFNAKMMHIALSLLPRSLKVKVMGMAMKGYSKV